MLWLETWPGLYLNYSTPAASSIKRGWGGQVLNSISHIISTDKIFK